MPLFRNLRPFSTEVTRTFTCSSSEVIAADEATARAIDAEGWLHTGDLATMRPDGCFHITGRLKEMIIRGGENISSSEVEATLAAHPAIVEAAVDALYMGWTHYGPSAGLPDLRKEIARWREYDYVIVNDDLQRAFDDLIAILRAERQRECFETARHFHHVECRR